MLVSPITELNPPAPVLAEHPRTIWMLFNSQSSTPFFFPFFSFLFRSQVIDTSEEVKRFWVFAAGGAFEKLENPLKFGRFKVVF
jgi:hypothetical protein